MTTTLIALTALAALALLGYLAATGRVADTRDGRDWTRTAPARTVRAAVRLPALLTRRFAARKVDLIAAVGDLHGADADRRQGAARHGK